MKIPTPDALWHTIEVLSGLWVGSKLNRWNEERKDKILARKDTSDKAIVFAGQQLTADTSLSTTLLTSMQSRITSQEQRMDRIQESHDKLQTVLDIERSERVRWQKVAQDNEIQIQVLQASETDLKAKVYSQSERLTAMQLRIVELEVYNKVLVTELQGSRSIGSTEIIQLQANITSKDSKDSTDSEGVAY